MIVNHLWGGQTRGYVAQYIVPVMTTNVQSDIVLLRVDTSTAIYCL
jgi:hypothetical protein